LSSVEAARTASRRPLAGRRLNLADVALQGAAAIAAASAAVLVGLIAYKLLRDAWPAISRYGVGFLTNDVWDPVANHYGAISFLFGTAITSIFALLLAGPLAIAIALYLTELAPRPLRGPVTALVETLAAIPSVVIGLWGILVLGPFLSQHIEPALHDAFGFIPLFGKPSTGPQSVFTAIVVLTIMILPIVASICRELFLQVPADLKEGALALGTTKWETIRAVVFPYTSGGITAALILGFGRAIGEAIAVTQVIGGGTVIGWNLFGGGDTLASKIAASYQGADTNIQIAALIYLGLILLIFSLVTNLVAQWVVRRFGRGASAVSRGAAAAGGVPGGATS
jgi:phosphate transport system permease protein